MNHQSSRDVNNEKNARENYTHNHETTLKNNRDVNNEKNARENYTHNHETTLKNNRHKF